MESEIVSLQNNPLLLAKPVEGTPPLTLVQNRILLYIFGKVLERSKANGWEISKMKDDEITMAMVHYDIPWDLEWEVKVGKGGNQTAEIWNQLETLHKTRIILKGSQRSTHIIQAIAPPKTADGKYRVQIDHEILRNIHYREKEIYRLIKMKYALALNSVNHFNLYKILKAVENMREWKVELEELKAMLHLQTQYPKYAHFRQWVLKPAQDELKSHTDISFTFEETRLKRKVTHLIFKVEVRKSQTIDQPKATGYTTGLESELKARGIQHLNKLASEGITEEHWRKAINADLREGALVVEARKHRDQVTGEENKAKAKKTQDETIKSNRRWWEENKADFPGWDDLGAYIMKGSKVVTFVQEDFQKKVGSHI